MTLGRTLSVALTGLDGSLVEVEADLAMGVPTFLIGGLPDAACRQSSERIQSGTTNSGLELPKRKFIVNLSPASLPKSGAGFDLAIAIACLVSCDSLAQKAVADVVHIGEVGLDGSIRPVRGVLPLVLAAVRAGRQHIVVPAANALEAELVPGAEVTPAVSLRQIVALHRARAVGEEPETDPWQAVRAAAAAGVREDEPGGQPDLADVVGQDEARLALEVAAAGGHHLYLIGPPGAGKTMLAERLPSLLPGLGDEDAMQVSAVHSILGELAEGALVRRPPFVAPHHGASMTAVIGGGSGAVRPGLISRAHRGVLFLDEAPEFRSQVLQALRQPLESGVVVVARARASVTYPARFQLILAANPCPCGHAFGKGLACSCTPKARREYAGKLAGPLLDRVDLQLEVPPVTLAGLGRGLGESSAVVAERVAAAREVQRRRYADQPWALNSSVPGPVLRRAGYAPPPSARVDLDRALARGTLTLRGFDRVLKLALSIADLAGGRLPTRDDVGLALTLRTHTAVAA